MLSGASWGGLGMTIQEETLGQTKDKLERLYLSGGLGTSRCPPRGVGGSCWGEKCLDCPRISGRKQNKTNLNDTSVSQNISKTETSKCYFKSNWGNNSPYSISLHIIFRNILHNSKELIQKKPKIATKNICCIVTFWHSRRMLIIVKKLPVLKNSNLLFSNCNCIRTSTYL